MRSRTGILVTFAAVAAFRPQFKEEQHRGKVFAHSTSSRFLSFFSPRVCWPFRNACFRTRNSRNPPPSVRRRWRSCSPARYTSLLPGSWLEVGRTPRFGTSASASVSSLLVGGPKVGVSVRSVVVARHCLFYRTGVLFVWFWIMGSSVKLPYSFALNPFWKYPAPV